MAEVPTPGQTAKVWCVFCFVSPVAGSRRLFHRGGTFKMANSRPTRLQREELKTTKNIVDVKMPALPFITFRLKDAENSGRNINNFYIHKALDSITGNVKMCHA